MASTKQEHQQPWGRVSGILAGSVATLIGVSLDLNPDVILVRAVVAGMGVAFIVMFTRGLLGSLSRQE